MTKVYTAEMIKKDVPRANVFVMDFECDGGVLPAEIDAIVNKPDSDCTEQELHAFLAWFYANASGDY